jgi:hypothetical protein
MARLVDDLVLGRLPVLLGDAVLAQERGADVGSYAHEVAAHVRSPRQLEHVVDLEGRLDEVRLHLVAGSAVEVGDREQVVLCQQLGPGVEEVGIEPGRRDAAALAVAAVPHLLERLQERAARERDARGGADHAAAALCLGLPPGDGRAAEGARGGDQPLGELSAIHRRRRT